MNRIPLFPAVLLEVYKCIGDAGRVKKWQHNFRTAVDSQYESQGKKSADLMMHIMTELDLDAESTLDCFGNIVDEWIPYQKVLELNTWTHNASKQQIVWHLLCYSYAPLLGRRLANWQLDQVGDPGMPSGEFWYLPQVNPDTGKLRMPVERVLNWWLDLTGGIEPVRQSLATNAKHEDAPDSIVRNLNKWKEGALPQLKKIEEYFSDDTTFEYKNAIDLRVSDDTDVRWGHYQTARQYIQQRQIGRAYLAKQIPLSIEQLNEVLDSPADSDADMSSLHQNFVRLISQRYGTPEN